MGFLQRWVSESTFAALIQKDGGIGPCDVLATGDPFMSVLLSTTLQAWKDKAE